MSELIPGKIYFGVDEERLRVVATEGKVVHVERPVSFERYTMSLANFRKFIAGSERRTYEAQRKLKGGGVDRRTVVERREDSVVYLDVAGNRKVVDLKKWNAWRKKAK